MNFASDAASDAESDNQWISRMIEENEKIAYYGRDSIERTYNALQRTGFTHKNSLSIIKSHPDVLRIKPSDIERRLDMWHMAQFSQPQFYELFVQCPELLDFNDEGYIGKRYANLREIFSTPKNIWRILMSSPNVMVENMKSIRKKTDYILNTMEADVTDLAKSGALGLPLKKIKTRHMLLVRLGIYKKKNIRASNLDINKNPRLFRIMDANDDEFARKTCGISMNELEAFCDLYGRELDEKMKEEIDYEEDTDSEYSDDDNSDEEGFDAREPEDYYDDRHRRKYKK